MLRARVGAALVLAVVALAPISLAHADETRVAVLPFSGPGAGKVRGSLIATLRQHGAAVVDSGEVKSGADRLGVDLSEPSQRTDLSRMYGVDAWIDGKIERERGENVVTLTISNGADGETIDVTSLGARNVNVLARVMRKNGWDLVEPSLQRAGRAQPVEAAAAPEPAPAAEEEEEPTRAVEKAEPKEEEEGEDEGEDEDEDKAGDEEEDDGSEGELPSPLRLELGLAGFSRVLEYRENIDRLPGYDIALPPAVRGLVIWYPAAHFTSSFPAHLGLRLHGQFAFGLSSQVEDADGPEFSTSSSLLEVGLRGRIPLDSFEIGASLSYGMHNYGVDSAKQDGMTVDPGIPSTGYSYAHVGLELRLQLGALGLAFGGAVMPLLGVGDLEKWFPHASGLGLEGSLELGYALGSTVDLFALLSARRYAVSFNPEVEDIEGGRALVGGMVDRYLHAQLGVRFVPGRQP